MQNHAILHQSLCVSQVWELPTKQVSALQIFKKLFQQDVCIRSILMQCLLYVCTISFLKIFYETKIQVVVMVQLFWVLSLKERSFEQACKLSSMYVYISLLQIFCIITHSLMMDANERKKKAPPLPKFFEQKAKDPSVIQKVTDFLQQISKEVSASQQNTQKPPIPSTITTATNVNVEDKKKFNMASLNSKLNSIIGNKKIDLNKVVQNAKKTQQQSEQKHRRDIQIQYDPAHPNSYEQSKSHYIEIFKKLKSNSIIIDHNSEQNEKISKAIAQFEKNGVQITEQPIVSQQNQMESQIKLDERESLALRMMQKYGFKVGQGLGKQSQGIKTPLTIKKLTDSSCKIQQSQISLANFVTFQQTVQNALLAFKIQKTTVIVLKIQMKLSQLSDEVQKQFKQQCEKFGNIRDWVAFSSKDSILFFCKYSSIQQAFKAFTRLNGRYYDQKVIRSYYYPQAAFEARRLSQNLHQTLQF